MGIRISRGGRSARVSVEFFIDDAYREVFPESQSANKFLPEYFKKLNPQITNDPESSTAKRCVPFLEAASQGFIIPLWSDVFVTATNGELTVKFPEGFPMQDSLGKHSPQQIQGHPYRNQKYADMPMKWINPWGIKTPKGYSCLITSPLNHLEKRFKILDGVVDTDTYYNHINFPFLWTAEKDGEYFLQKGMPLIHVIPFKRETYTSTITNIDFKKYNDTRAKIGTMLRDKYRTLFWHKAK